APTPGRSDPPQAENPNRSRSTDAAVPAEARPRPRARGGSCAKGRVVNSVSVRTPPRGVKQDWPTRRPTGFRTAQDVLFFEGRGSSMTEPTFSQPEPPGDYDKRGYSSGDVLRLLANPRCPAHTIRAVAEDGRFQGQYRVRLTIVTHPAAPLAVSLRLL